LAEPAKELRMTPTQRIMERQKHQGKAKTPKGREKQIMPLKKNE
jgi:hypothetical protein